MQPDLSLNPFIASHLPALMNHIQELAISQYVVPFVSVRLQVSVSVLLFSRLMIQTLNVYCFDDKSSGLVFTLLLPIGACNYIQHGCSGFGESAVQPHRQT